MPLRDLLFFWLLFSALCLRWWFCFYFCAQQFLFCCTRFKHRLYNSHSQRILSVSSHVAGSCVYIIVCMDVERLPKLLSRVQFIVILWYRCIRYYIKKPSIIFFWFRSLFWPLMSPLFYEVNVWDKKRKFAFFYRRA